MSYEQATQAIANDPNADLIIPWLQRHTAYVGQDLARFLIWLNRPISTVGESDVHGYLEILSSIASRTVATRVTYVLRLVIVMLRDNDRLPVFQLPSSSKKHVSRTLTLSLENVDLVVTALKLLGERGVELAARIEGGPTHPLTPEEKQTMVALYNSGNVSRSQLAEQFSVSRTSVSNVLASARSVRKMANKD